MPTVIKAFFGIFILGGIAISLYAGWEILVTINFVETASEHLKGRFAGYDTIEVESTSSTTDIFGNFDSVKTTSYMSYPIFEFTDRNGEKRQVRESKSHVFERFKPGQDVEIIGSPYGAYHLADFYSLYFRDLCILFFGLAFIIFPLILWRGFSTVMKTPEGNRFVQFIPDTLKTVLDIKAEPFSFTIRSLFKGIGVFMLLVMAVSAISYAVPFIKNLHLGSGWDLFKALEEKRFDEAHGLILKGKGINKTDEYNQCPIHLALEADRFDLAQLLIEAGADVNAKNIYGQTPLQVVVRKGNLQFAKLLVSKGASLEPGDGSPPVVIAISRGYDDIARLLIESGCDLKREYVERDFKYTVGDITILAKKPELAELVRSRGGTFTIKP